MIKHRKEKKKCKEKKKLKQHACVVQLGYSRLRACTAQAAGSKAGGSKFTGLISYGVPSNFFRRWLLILQRARHIVAAI